MEGGKGSPYCRTGIRRQRRIKYVYDGNNEMARWAKYLSHRHEGQSPEAHGSG